MSANPDSSTSQQGEFSSKVAPAVPIGGSSVRSSPIKPLLKLDRNLSILSYNNFLIETVARPQSQRR